MSTTIEDRLVLGDTTAVADLYRQHGTFVHTVSQALVGAAADRLTQQIFVEAWRDRLDFDPSMGTVRNWFVRRARDRVSKPSVEADAAVDRLVVADSLNRMDDIRQRVLRAGVGARHIDELAAEMDLPVATVNGHLRRGMDGLKADLADSRADGSDAALAAILSDGTPDAELNEPPDVVWTAVVAELRLTGDAADLNHVSGMDVDDEAEADVPEEKIDVADAETVDTDPADTEPADTGSADTGSADTGSADTGSAETESVDAVVNEASDSEDADAEDADVTDDETVSSDDKEAGVAAEHDEAHVISPPDSTEDADGDMEALRADAASADLDRPIWQIPAAVILALMIVAVLIAIIF